MKLIKQCEDGIIVDTETFCSDGISPIYVKYHNPVFSDGEVLNPITQFVPHELVTEEYKKFLHGCTCIIEGIYAVDIEHAIKGLHHPD